MFHRLPVLAALLLLLLASLVHAHATPLGLTDLASSPNRHRDDNNDVTNRNHRMLVSDDDNDGDDSALIAATAHKRHKKAKKKPTHKPTQVPTASPTKHVFKTSGGHVPEGSSCVFPFKDVATGKTYQSCVQFEPAKKFPFVGANYRDPVAPYTKSYWCYVGSGDYSPTDAANRLQWGFCHEVTTSGPTNRPASHSPTSKGSKSSSPTLNSRTKSPTHKGAATKEPSTSPTEVCPFLFLVWSP